MNLQTFIECAVADFMAYRNRAKLNTFKTFVESLGVGATTTDRNSINAMVEGIDVLIEATFTSNSPYVRSVTSIYDKAREATPPDEEYPGEYEFADKMYVESENVDQSSDNITRFSRSESLNSMNQALQARGQIIDKMRREQKFDEKTATTMKSRSVYIFIGALSDLMIREINKSARSMNNDDAQDFFSDYLMKIVSDATKVINGTKDRVDLMTNNSYDIRDLQSKYVDVSHIYKSESGSSVHVWKWKDLAGDKIVNSDKFRPGRSNATAVTHNGQFYVRAPKSVGDIPEDLLAVSPDSEEVSKYWVPTMLYKVGGNTPIGSGDEHQTTVIDKRTDSAVATGDDIGINTRPDLSDDTDYTDSADEIINSLFSDEEHQLNEIIASGKPRDIEAAKAKLNKIHSFRAGFMAKVTARRNADELSADKARNLADTQYASFSELRTELARINARQAEIDTLLSKSRNARKSLKLTPSSDRDVVELSEVSANIMKLLKERESNKAIIAKITTRLADENRTTETETAAVKRVMGNAQTLDNNMPEIHDDILKQMRAKGFNIKSDKYARQAGVKGVVFTPGDKEILAKLAEQFGMTPKKVIDIARELNISPKDDASRRKLVAHIVDTYE